MQYNKGFTFLELVIVIIVVGILLAYALPRYMNVTTETHTYAVNKVASAMQQASDILRAVHKRAGSPGIISYLGNDYSFVTDDLPIVVLSEWPVGPADLSDSVITAVSCAILFNSIISGDLSAPTGGTTSGTVFEAFGSTGADDPNSCQYNYLLSNPVKKIKYFYNTGSIVVE